MDVIQVYAVAGAVVIGAAFGFVAAGIVGSGSRRSKFHRQAFTMEGDRPVVK